MRSRISHGLKNNFHPGQIIAHNPFGLPILPEEQTMMSIPLREFMSEFLEAYEPPARAPTTCRLMRQSLRELAEDPRIAGTGDLSPASICRFIRRYPGRTPITASVHLRNLRVFSNVAVGRGLLAGSPFSLDIKLQKACHVKRVQKQRHHSLLEIGCVLGYLRDRAYLSWEDHRIYALGSLVAWTGCRAREAQFAEVADFDLAEGFFTIQPKPGHPLKTESSEREVPIPAALSEVLRSWLPKARSTWAFPGRKRFGPWTQGLGGTRPLDKLKEAGLAVQVRGFTFLSLRHSFVTHGSGPWSMGSLTIQAIAGHSIEETQKHYRGRDRDNLRAAATAIAFPIPVPVPIIR
jgi:integrase